MSQKLAIGLFLLSAVTVTLTIACSGSVDSAEPRYCRDLARLQVGLFDISAIYEDTTVRDARGMNDEVARLDQAVRDSGQDVNQARADEFKAAVDRFNGAASHIQSSAARAQFFSDIGCYRLADRNN